MHVNSRVQKHRDALRLAGLRPLQIWVPDTRLPGFSNECFQQCILVAESDITDSEMSQFMDSVLAVVDGWVE
jgi:Protein  of unknown function (DUF3018)